MTDPDPAGLAAGGGVFDASTDLGRSYLAVDWTATPLGDPATWSDSLKSTVRLMLASRFAMWMGWGPELTFFCNEAYRRDSLGAKYPWALGRPTGEVWSEIWDQLTDRVAAVTVAGESTWDEELQLFVQRSGYLEETFHTFSYSPLSTGDGTIVGLLCVVNEVTEGVVNTRRIAAVSDLNAELAAATTEREVSAAARTALARYPAEFPFVAAYVLAADGATAALAWTCGLAPGRPATPEVLDLAAGDHPWAVAAAVTGVAVLEDTGELLAELPLDAQGSRPTRAVAVTIAHATPETVDGHEGFLVVAPSAHRPWDESYAAFVDLVAGQFGAALSRARAFEAERDQAIVVAAREHAIAAELQSSLLPSHDFAVDHLDVASFYRAGVEGTDVGGDWYDVIDLGPGRTALVIGDVMGRGVQAAAVMGQLRASVRAYARLELAPDVVLGLLDETVRELGPSKIVTCVYAVYDPADHSLVYANAGHLPPLVTRPDGSTVELSGGGPPLGTGRGWPKAESVTLPVGTTLTLYTDGAVETRGSDVGDGIATLADLLGTTTAPLEELPDRLVAALMPEGSDDDIALLVARVSDRAHHDRVARAALGQDRRHVAAARQFVTGTLQSWHAPADTVDDAELVVSELVTNAFVHARTDVVLTLRAAASRLFVEVHDDVATSPQPRDALPSDVNGRGLAIVATLATRWGTRQTPLGKAVWCELPLAVAGA